MATKARKRKPQIAEPTPEQQAGGSFVLDDVTDKRNGGGSITIGKAYRRRPMIETLARADVISVDEYKALKHYRHHADLADRSPVRDSLCLQRGNRGGGPTISTINAIQIVSDCERAAGSLVDILRAVVVYDVSLSQWAMSRHGSTDRCRLQNGVRVCRPEPSNSAVKIARLELKMAAKRVHSELVA